MQIAGSVLREFISWNNQPFDEISSISESRIIFDMRNIKIKLQYRIHGVYV
jgi:hypothetical protein